VTSTYVYLSLAICAEVFGTLALKSSDGFTRLWPSALVFLCYGVAFYFLGVTLRAMPVGIAYAVWSGMGIVLISSLSWAVFRQSLDGPALIGMGLIIAGVLVINLMSRSTLH
jgi:small multidrug resistance pump